MLNHYFREFLAKHGISSNYACEIHKLCYDIHEHLESDGFYEACSLYVSNPKEYLLVVGRANQSLLAGVPMDRLIDLVADAFDFTAFPLSLFEWEERNFANPKFLAFLDEQAIGVRNKLGGNELLDLLENDISFLLAEYRPKYNEFMLLTGYDEAYQRGFNEVECSVFNRLDNAFLDACLKIVK